MKYALPASVGIPALAILNTLQDIQGAGLEIHSFCLMRHQKIATEAYFSPITADSLHRMYSITKSLTALAIGLLEQDGKLEITDTIASYFPEYVPKNLHPWLKTCTIRNLLCMQSCHRKTTYKADISKNWVESFFTTPPNKPPGEMFHYDTSATHVLTAIVERLCGTTLMEFLRERVLDQIGFSKNAYILSDPFGTSIGGSGLVAKPIDLIRLGKLFLDNGKWDGVQLLPEKFLKEAVSYQVPTFNFDTMTEKSYGYQFWQIQDGGFAAIGKGGQYLACWPKHELVIATTADTQNIPGDGKHIFNIITNRILKAINTKNDNEAENQSALDTFVSNAKILPLQTVSTNTNFGGEYEISDNPNFTLIRWIFENDHGAIELATKFGTKKIGFGIGRTVSGQFPFKRENSAWTKNPPCPKDNGGLYTASAGWVSDRELVMKISLLEEEVASVHIRAVFAKNSCTIEMRNTCEMCYEQFKGLWWAKRI